MHSHVFLKLAIAAVALATMTQAQAERADRDKQVVIEYDRAVANLAAKSGTLEGNVILEQGTLRITAPKLNFKRDANDNVFAELFGSGAQRVTFRERREGYSDFTEGEAERAEYDQRANTIKLFNRARIVSAGNEMTSDYILYNTGTDEFLVDGQAPGSKTPSSANGTAAARSRMVLPPPSAREKQGEKQSEKQTDRPPEKQAEKK